MLWIDEARDLFDRRSPRELDDMLKMLKSLMQGDAAVIVVLSGTDLLSGIVRSDPQIDRRFRKIYPRTLAVGADTADVADLVRLYCDEAGLRCAFKSNPASRLIHASRGRFGRIIETAIDATGRALQEGAQS
ncbi:TniB family NTP-binding protein [Paenirhodobacter sp.]|uniref:TniB family NTP-binding protein n=1 Tax=Paenirhodobacter sp. TaxID=1965326 RepID=UPI003B50ACA6